jgi:hypothetical protein
MRIIVRKERPHPGAQLRLTGIDGHRITAFATNTTRGQLADLELRHRRRARCEDRLRNAKDTGLSNLPARLHAEPDLVRRRGARLRTHRLDADTRPHRPRGPPLGAQTPTATPVSIAGRLADHGPTRRLHLSAHEPWADQLAKMITTLQTIPAPG